MNRLKPGLHCDISIKHKHEHKHNECSHLLHKHKESDMHKRNELQNEAVGAWDEARFQGFSCCFCCSVDARYFFTRNFLITAAFISETCESSLTSTYTKVFLFVTSKSSELGFVIETGMWNKQGLMLRKR